MSSITRRRRPIFNRHRSSLPIIRVLMMAAMTAGAASAGFAAGVTVGAAQQPAHGKEAVRTLASWTPNEQIGP